VNRYGERFDNLYSISADCPGVMSVEDYEQLSEEDPQDLTRQVLHFTSQGGILPSRHQSSCQMCEDPFPSEVDLEFKLFGVSTDEQLMLNFKDPYVAQALSEQTPASEIPESSLVRREQVLQDLARWRASSFEKRKVQLGPDMISLQGLAAHLQSCESCRSSLKKHCPLIDIEMFVVADESRLEQFRDWLHSCSGCGVCEKDCPQDYPLSGVIFSLRGIHKN
jgi:Pyruvate/2-oxoacid:ferredoxin oxidoreductase delta subunit